MQRPNAKRSQELYQHFSEHKPPYCNVDSYLDIAKKAIVDNSNKIASIKQRLAFEKELISSIPLSDGSKQILSDLNVTTFQHVIDHLDVIILLDPKDQLMIKKYVDQKYFQTHRVKLSLDEKTSFATDLLIAVTRYIRLNKLKNNGMINIEYYESDINRLMKYMEPALSKLAWLFTNQRDKEYACQAFDKLEQIYSMYPIAEQNNKIIMNKWQVENDYAWEVFRKYSTNVFKVVEELNPDVVAPDADKINIIDLNAIELKYKPKQVKNNSKQKNDTYQDVNDKYIKPEYRKIDSTPKMISNEQIKQKIINEMSRNKTGLTARELAYLIGVDKSRINAVLYANTTLFVKNDTHIWKIKEPPKTSSSYKKFEDQQMRQMEAVIKERENREKDRELFRKTAEKRRQEEKKRIEAEYKQIAEEVSKTPIQLNGLNASLRKYQEFGVQFMVKHDNVLIGDEMGLGKTVETLATILHNANNGGTHFIIICPLSVLVNWCREAKKFTNLEVYKLHKETLADVYKWIKYGGIAVATYESIKKLDVDKYYPDIIAVDEAHNIKNPSAQRTQVIAKLCKNSKKIIFLTGTPLENKSKEMADLIGILDKDVGKKLASFDNKPEKFKYAMRHIYLRRKREDVLAELPDKIEEKRWLRLGPEEYTLYLKNLQDDANYMLLRQLSWDVGNLSKSCKNIELQSIIQSAIDEDRKLLVFSFFRNTLDVIEREYPNRVIGKINGSVSSSERQRQIDAFEEAPAGSILLLQVVSGGIGLNIQSASVVVFCEPQVKPSMEWQALSRAYRMGQTRNVLVYRLLCEDTIEEQMDEILAVKEQIFNDFADESEIAKADELLNGNTMKSLVQKEKEKHLKKQPSVNEEYSIQEQIDVSCAEYNLI